MLTLRFRRGPALSMLVCVDGPDGDLADLTGCTFTSQVRDALGTLVAALTVTPVPGQAGQITLTVSDTSEWPLGPLWCDFCVTWPSGLIQASDVWMITLVRGVTRVREPQA